MADSETRPDPDVPPSVTPQRQTDNSGPYGEDLLPMTTRTPVRAKSPQSPVTDDETYHRGTVRRDRVRLGVEIAALFVGLAGVTGLIVTYWATQVANKTARDALDHTVKMSRLDQRPWVGQRRTIAPANVVVGVNSEFGIEFTNSGKTPALYVKNIMRGRKLYKSNPISIEHIDYEGGLSPSNQTRSSVGVLFPEVVNSIKIPDVTITQQQIEMLRSGDLILHFYGEIEYADVHSEYHCTMYCFSFLPDLQRAVPCSVYNEVKDTKCDNIK